LWLASAGALSAFPTSAHAIGPFVDASTLLADDEIASGVAIAIEDMNGDCLDDIVRLNGTWSLSIEFQQEDGTYTAYDFGSVDGTSWSLAVGDVDGNGYGDIFTGGSYDGIKVLTANEDGTDWTMQYLEGGPEIFVQCSNFADIDNNGTLDLFVCNDDDLSSPYNNDGNGNFTYDLGLIDPQSTWPPVPGSNNSDDDSGNYGTVWTDYDNDGDIDLFVARCRQGVDNPDDPRRINSLYRNDGLGNYTDVADAAGLVPQAQSWAIDFADYDNDGDFDAFMVNHNESSSGPHSMLYENMGPENIGVYEDVTAASGVEMEIQALEMGIQTHFEDFDNDTFVDILMSTRTGVHGLFMGNGDGTFTEEIDAFPTGGLGIQSFAIGDLDSDGFPDVLAGFATGFNQPSEDNPDKVFLNPTNDNNWFNVRLTGAYDPATGEGSNVSAVGARVELNGAWGTQTREVRAGESYGITNSLTRHFGLGQADAIDSLVITWPDGSVDTAPNPDINQTVHVTQGCPDLYFADSDGDGFGDAENSTTLCLPQAGYVVDDTDCDDSEGASFPGNEEICDEIDNDCNGEVDDGIDCEPDDSSTGEETGTGDESSTETGGGTETGDDDPGQSESGGGGCGCTTSPSPEQGWLGLALFGLFGLTRRRR
jgi:MYXO-CTERM domain-containing protein